MAGKNEKNHKPTSSSRPLMVTPKKRASSKSDPDVEMEQEDTRPRRRSSSSSSSSSLPKQMKVKKKHAQISLGVFPSRPCLT